MKENEKENIKTVSMFLNTWEKQFKSLKFFTLAVVVLCGFVTITIAGIAFYNARKSASKIYVLDQGRSLIALQSEGAATKDLEVRDHVTRFHELFFNIAPNAEAIEQNLNRAFILCDRSAYNYYQDLSEKGYFQRMISANIIQQLVVDSVAVDVSTYPYRAHVYAKNYLIRESQISLYDFESTCNLIQMQRSDSNPHGLLMEKFTVIKNEERGTRKR